VVVAGVGRLEEVGAAGGVRCGWSERWRGVGTGGLVARGCEARARTLDRACRRAGDEPLETAAVGGRRRCDVVQLIGAACGRGEESCAVREGGS